MRPFSAPAACAEKTAVGNVYRGRRFAKKVAEFMRRATGDGRIRAYRCEHCHAYHLGKRPGRSFTAKRPA